MPARAWAKARASASSLVSSLLFCRRVRAHGPLAHTAAPHQSLKSPTALPLCVTHPLAPSAPLSTSACPHTFCASKHCPALPSACSSALPGLHCLHRLALPTSRSIAAPALESCRLNSANKIRVGEEEVCFSGFFLMKADRDIGTGEQVLECRRVFFCMCGCSGGEVRGLCVHMRSRIYLQASLHGLEATKPHIGCASTSVCIGIM